MSRIKEKSRLQALKALQIIDTPSEETFDDFAWLAATLCGVSMSLVSLDDAERLWFKARCGLDLENMPREGNFCSYAIEQDGVLEVSDAQLDKRFANLHSVVEFPYLRFYAGTPLIGSGGHRYGTLCVMDTQPRKLTDIQKEGLHRLARRVSEGLELRKEKILAQSRETAITELLDVLPDGVVTCDASGVLREFNAVSRDWHGVDVRACPPEDWAKHFGLHDEKNDEFLQPQQIPLARAWRGERVRGQTMVIRTPDKPARIVSCNANPLLSSDGTVLGAVCTMHDVTLQIQYGNLMKFKALTDELTGLPNRAAWLAELDRALAWSKRSGHGTVIMFIDLNDFKQINDTLGHAAGDEVLRQFSSRLKTTCRQTDFVARLSGDEFVVCLTRFNDKPVDINEVARRIHQAFSAGIQWNDQVLQISCSIGFAIDESLIADAKKLMEKADQAMYTAKRKKDLYFSLCC
ncbi:MAG: diguanylate cyclase [Pseudomonas sp.]|nr:MAG: diguanylate cyclase [Pseudomonas sp.]